MKRIEYPARTMILLQLLAVTAWGYSFQVSPATGSRFFTGDTIKLSCVLHDSLGNPVDLLSVRWISSVSGEIGDSACAPYIPSESGEHVISVEATASKHDTLRASTAITVVPFDSITVYCFGGNSATGAVWKDNTMHTLPGYRGELISGTVFDGVAYALDEDYSLGYSDTIRYWADTALTSLAAVGRPLSIYVNERGLWLAGHISQQSCYWHGTTSSMLDPVRSTAVSIAVESDTAYVLTRQMAVPYVVSIWKNGQFHTEVARGIVDSNTYVHCEGYWIGVKNGIVRAGGRDNIAVEDYSLDRGWVWNGQKVPLFDSTGDSTLWHAIRPLDFCMDDTGGVYVVGEVLAPGPRPSAWIWENGKAREWRDPVTGGIAGAFAVYMLNGHLFVGGAYLKDDSTVSNCYWRNGVRYDLPGRGAEGDYYIYDMVVVEGYGSTDARPSSRTLGFGRVTSGRLSASVSQHGALRAYVQLPRDGVLQIDVLSMSGRVLFSERVGYKRSGKHTVRLGYRLPAHGVYSVVARVAGTVSRTQVKYVR
ncbi:MAG: hypothetical protein GF331_21035 [Chitinivibrionales bacterium]|nr:hypothetical protein [Chitinivibrionales bacterium]